jgi:hypothetical protein
VLTRLTLHHIKNSNSSCTVALHHSKTSNKHHGDQLKLKTKPGGEEPAAHLRRRRASRSQEQVQEVKDKLAAEPGGVGRIEASHTNSKQQKLCTALALHNYRHQVDILQAYYG